MGGGGLYFDYLVSQYQKLYLTISVIDNSKYIFSFEPMLLQRVNHSKDLLSPTKNMATYQMVEHCNVNNVGTYILCRYSGSKLVPTYIIIVKATYQTWNNNINNKESNIPKTMQIHTIKIRIGGLVSHFVYFYQ